MSNESNLYQKVYLIGDPVGFLSENTLPTQGEVLKVLFFHTRQLKPTIRDSARIVVREVISLRKKAGIRTQTESKGIEKLKTLYQSWQKVQKNAHRISNAENEEKFRSRLDTMFDIASQNPLQVMDELTKEFLINQRKNPPQGSITNMQIERRKVDELKKKIAMTSMRQLKERNNDINIFDRLE